jgi:hypothetical protein
MTFAQMLTQNHPNVKISIKCEQKEKSILYEQDVNQTINVKGSQADCDACIKEAELL